MKRVTGFLCAMMALGASAKTDTMIVFDASGSMWGQIEGKTKMEIAKSAITSISEGFTADQVVGLMAYGHRQKGDCGDIELLVSPATGTAESIVNQTMALQPKGKTPLSAAVKMAAEQLKYTENKAEVVLITDGVETCNLDPCALANELENNGIDFTAHVIGFGLTADEGKQVSCLADITGGRYVSTDNAASLNEALQQVIMAEETPEVEVEIPTATIEAPTEEVVIGAGFTVTWTGPNSELDYIDVVNTGYHQVHGELAYNWTKSGSPLSLSAPGKPGSYDLRYIWQGPKQRHILAAVSIEVIESKVSIVAPNKVNAGDYFSVEWHGPNNTNDYVDLVDKGYTQTSGELSYFYTKEGTPGNLQAPAEPGTYDLRYVLQATDGRQVLYKTSIEVNEVAASLSFDPQAEIGSTINVYWTGPNNKGGYIDLVPAAYTKTSGEMSYFYLKDTEDVGSLLAPVDAGEYQIRFIMVGADGRHVIASSPITITETSASLQLAATTLTVGSSLEVSWQGPGGTRDYVDLVPVDQTKTSGELSYFYTSETENKGVLTVPNQPGQYKVRYVLQGASRKVLAETNITVQ